MSEKLQIYERFTKLILLSSIFILVSIVYTLPLVYTFSNWGQNDWDQFIFWNAVPRVTMLEYHQFPLWNPYGNGGNVLLAHPHSSFLSPFYILVLIFGPLIGLKIEIIVHLFLGMLGMYFLSKHLQLGEVSSYIPPFVFMLSSIYPLHITEGHAEWLAMAFFPWLFLFYEKGLENKKYLLAGILSFSLIYLAGSVDVSHISITFLFLYATFKSIQRKSIQPLKILISIFVAVALLCAIKMVPMLEFLCHYPRFTIENDGIGLTTLAKMLLSRNQALYVNQRIDGQHYWHEYGAYVGISLLLLFVIGAFIKGRRKWPLSLTGVICLFIAMGSKAPINLWKILHFFPPYKSQTVPSRYMLGVIFCISLFSGIGTLYLEQLALKIKNKKKQLFYHLFIIGGIMLIVLDLYFVNSPILEKAFTNSPIHMEKHETFQQRYIDFHFQDFKSLSNLMYPVVLSNSGIISSYEVIAVKRGDVRTVNDPGYRGEAYLANNKGNISIVSFSPNKVIIDVNVYERDNLVLNQNYYTGWRVIDNGRRRNVRPYKGLISMPVTAGYHRIKFYYLPISFLIGTWLSISFILILLFYYQRNIKNMLQFLSIFGLYR